MHTKSRTNIADEFGVCRKTLRKWMDAMPYEFPYLLTTQWQKLIYEEIGYPFGLKSASMKKSNCQKNIVASSNNFRSKLDGSWKLANFGDAWGCLGMLGDAWGCLGMLNFLNFIFTL